MKKSFLTVLLLLLLCTAVRMSAQGGPQLYNMGFDHWSKHRGAWNPYPEDATASQRVWDTANRGLSILGVNTTMPEYEHVAVPGKGKAAAKIVSRKVTWVFVTGNLFNGRFLRVVNLSGAEIAFGVPFRARPRSLSGWYHYKPGIINYAKEPCEDLMGKLDEGKIDVMLTDWSTPYRVIAKGESVIDVANDPHIIAFGLLRLTRDTKGYVHFELPLEYRSEARPAYVVISACSSRFGEYFTGSSESILYVDEFRFNY